MTKMPTAEENAQALREMRESDTAYRLRQAEAAMSEMMAIFFFPAGWASSNWSSGPYRRRTMRFPARPLLTSLPAAS